MGFKIKTAVMMIFRTHN